MRTSSSDCSVGVTGRPPNVAVMPGMNPYPFAVTVWPPLVGPPAGESEVTTAGP